MQPGPTIHVLSPPVPVTIELRSGGGRGAYEIAGLQNAKSGPNAILNKSLVLHFPPSTSVATKLQVVDSGGKLRFITEKEQIRRASGAAAAANAGNEVRVNRQLAAILLLPNPTGYTDSPHQAPLPSRDGYMLWSVEGDVLEIRPTEFVVMPRTITLRNGRGEIQVDAQERFRAVAKAWAKRFAFPGGIPVVLSQHELAVRTGGAIGEEVVNQVATLQDEIYTRRDELTSTFEASMDPLPVLSRVARQLTVSLATKPFAILTGPSGTGKSRQAIELAVGFDYGPQLPPQHRASRTEPATNLAFVPVGANWTDQTPLLGYRNPFGTQRTVNGTQTNDTYDITATLLMLLRASHKSYASTPHFLILDEMNLSHVERYFSPFLSLMEADAASDSTGQMEIISRGDLQLIKEVLEHDKRGPLECEAIDQLLTLGRGLPFPRNVYVVGTVNVDETTYMFSPKVLDRAFVHELNAVRPSDHIAGKSPSEDQLQREHAIEVFGRTLAWRASRRWNPHRPAESLRLFVVEAGYDEKVVDPISKAVATALDGVYRLLQPVGFGFGFRVTNDVMSYMATWLVSEKLASPKGVPSDERWRSALDRCIAMKVLPKIHGNRSQLDGALTALRDFLADKPAQYTLGQNESIALTTPEDKVGFPLPVSGAKVGDMLRVLKSAGYTTFIH